jgi:peptidoglycan/xylan/chitin deacetylase (PgdA/CDA1 family)
VPSFGQLRETGERWRRFPGLERLDGAERQFALTFDDGPDPDATPAVLEALDEGAAKATFFLVGERVEAEPALAREIAARGHAVALHGHRHVEQDTLTDPADDLRRCRAAVEAATGATAALFRPPFGRFSEASHAACRGAGLTPVYWSGWGCDWEPIPVERIVDLATRDLEAGTIMLLHDSPRYAYRDSAKPTAAALAPILAAARERGLEPVLLR